jgi:hypothetical protein
MKRKPFTFEGTEYKSKTAAAIAIMGTGKTMSEAADIVGITYQTVFANTKGLEKRKVNMGKKRAVSLAKTGKYGIKDLAERTSLTPSTIETLLKKASIKVGELKAKRIAEKKAKVEAKKAAKPVKAAKVQRIRKPKAAQGENPTPAVPVEKVAPVNETPTAAVPVVDLPSD